MSGNVHPELQRGPLKEPLENDSTSAHCQMVRPRIRSARSALRGRTAVTIDCSAIAAALDTTIVTRSCSTISGTAADRDPILAPSHPMIPSVSRLWSRTIKASLPTTTARLLSTTSATRLAAPYTTDMDRVPTTERLHKLRELMQSHKVDIYSTPFFAMRPYR